jgi:sulfate/thiosulfate transport system permease protein
VMVAGNQPLATKTAPLYIFGEIESGNRHGALVISVALLASSLMILLVLNGVQRRWGAEHGH